MKSPPAKFLLTSEVARRLEVSVGTVREWERLGYLRAQRTAGGVRLFDACDVEESVHARSAHKARRTMTGNSCEQASGAETRPVP